jgi:hypothetical protein
MFERPLLVKPDIQEQRLENLPSNGRFTLESSR